MRRMAIAVTLLVAGAGLWALSPGARTTVAVVADDDARVLVLDDCDPNDWAGPPPGGGCALEEGDVTRAEFNALRFSPLQTSSPPPVIGHQAWRNDPSYLKVEEGDTVKVKNKGGRGHTFTKVAAFGGGLVPGLNQGLVPAPECATAANLPPGAKEEVSGLSVGNHRFQCCFHPWMRTLIKVKPAE